jgi:hypothetical protein
MGTESLTPTEDAANLDTWMRAWTIENVVAKGLSPDLPE